jgi:UDP-glucuronate decarboxylase
MQLPDCSLLLTGGTGFIGRALLRHWETNPADRPYRVVAISRNPQAFAQSFPELAGVPWLDLRHGDVTVMNSLPRESFDTVIHAAADSTMGPQLSPLQRYTQIVDGTRHLLDLAVAARARRFLLLSSGAVYGSRSAGQPDPEESDCNAPDPLNPENAYGIAKRTAEHLGALAHREHELEVVIARCFAFVGRDLPLDVHFAIGNFIRDALWRESITVNGDGTPVRSYMDQRDLSRWLLALLCQGRAGQAYNVGSDQSVNMADLAHLVRDMLAPSKSVHIEAAKDFNFRSRYVPSTMKARSEMSLNLEHTLEESIANTAYFASNQIASICTENLVYRTKEKYEQNTKRYHRNSL